MSQQVEYVEHLTGDRYMRVLTSILGILTIITLATNSEAQTRIVTYHEPNSEMEKNLNYYGTGVENWEEKQFVQFTMADAHLYHHYALVPHNPDNVMPLQNLNTFDVRTFMIDDVIPGRKISMYDVMRDRANIQNYVIMNKKGEILASFSQCLKLTD